VDGHRRNDRHPNQKPQRSEPARLSEPCSAFLPIGRAVEYFSFPAAFPAILANVVSAPDSFREHYLRASAAKPQSAQAPTRRSYTPDIRSACVPLLLFPLHANSGIWGKDLNPLRK
jgi:hypothetical protein